MRFLIALALLPFAFAADVHLLQKPAMNKTQIVFSYAGDLWTVSRTGGVANRLTGGQGIETLVSFSPDGGTIAFTGQYDGNTDVFTVPVTGGVPKRITYHPDPDHVVGWTPDGKRILFRSTRESFSRYSQLFTASLEGGLPEVLPLPMAATGAYSPDGKRMVYAPLDPGNMPTGFDNFVSWRRYRGGRAGYLWVVNFADLTTQKIPRTDSNDINPMWIGDKVYFLSDRDGSMTLFRYDPGTKQVAKVIPNSGKDIVHASAGPGGIVYEQFGAIHVYDVATNKTQAVPIEILADLTEVRPRFQNVATQIANVRVSPTGARAVFEAHGEILTAPAESGDIRNMTNTPGVMERSPAWSPDGKSIAYFSEHNGEYALFIKAQNGGGEPQKIPLAGNAAYYFEPKWSPDSKRIAFTDNQLHLWEVDVASGKATNVDTDHLYQLGRDFSWAPDSKWIAFQKALPNRLRAIFIYSIDGGKSVQITDGMSDAGSPVFDRDGQYLYFKASTNYGPTTSGLDMTSDEHEVTSNIYLAVLPNNIQSPLAPDSDEEKPAEPRRPVTPPAADAPPKPVRIDFDKIQQRIVALPLSARQYLGIEAGRPGILFLMENAQSAGVRGGFSGVATLSRFDLKTKKTEKLADRITFFDLSANGDRMLIRMAPPQTPIGGASRRAAPTTPPPYHIVSSATPVKPGEGVLELTEVMVNVDPLAEWKQMYHEAWRIQKSYFYDPGLHGVNLADSEREYEKYLGSLGSRSDLNYIFQNMLSEMSVGHLRGGGGTLPQARTVPGGLLGADYEIANGRYRIKRIYNGESWNPQLQGPLAAPGLNINPGDYLLSINGRELEAKDDVSRLLEGTAGKHTLIRVGPDPVGAGSREMTVLPVAAEQPLRHQAWIEANRRKVDEMSGGKLAYVYLPDTAVGGLTNFNRYYFAQTDKQGAVIDERFNSGGQAADYIINAMNRPLQGWWSPRYGAIYRTPAAAIYGPKVMIINEFAGSGGDMMPWMFRATKTGTLIGKRTWGGLVGVSQYPTLMDGGTVTAPNFAFFNQAGEWDVENKGVAPDVEVDMDPKSVKEGHDPQLEKAVAIAMEQMKTNPAPQPKRPSAYPNYQRPAQSSRPATGTGGNR